MSFLWSIWKVVFSSKCNCLFAGKVYYGDTTDLTGDYASLPVFRVGLVDGNVSIVILS